MKRTTIPVLLVVLALLCGVFASVAVAGNVDRDGAMLVPSADRHQSDQILDLYGDSNDGSKGDPSTLGDGYGVAGDGVVVTVDSQRLESNVRLAELIRQLMDYITILH